MALNFTSAPEQHDLLARMVSGIQLVYALPFDVNLRKVQDLHYRMARRNYPEFRKKAKEGDPPAGRWVADFKNLSAKLMIRLDP